jgi:hypothetical protein
VSVLYVYAVSREPVIPDVEGIDGTTRFGTVTAGQLSATFSSTDVSQEVIDQRANDVEWLGAVGYRHQNVVSAMMTKSSVVPLRAFTLFSSAEALRSWMSENRQLLASLLERLDGKREWTLRIELEPQRWSEALVRRVESLSGLQKEIESAAPGRAFLLRKKMDDEKKKQAREAEQELVREIEAAVVSRLRCEAVAETRERREGAFPQLNVLIARDEEAVLQETVGGINARYGQEGVVIGVTGPWPPYTFAAMNEHGR